MADKPFRVLLDLTDLHIENFKYVWINVSPRELKTISDFKVALLHKINLERDDIKLFIRDGLLLDQETIMVLREDDTIKVQYGDNFQSFTMEKSARESKKKSRKRNYSECSISDISLNEKQYRMDNEISNRSNKSSSVEMNTKKMKKGESSHSASMDTLVNHSETSENNQKKIKSQKKKQKTKSALLENNATEGTESNLNQSDSFFSFDYAESTADPSVVAVNASADNVKSTNDSSQTLEINGAQIDKVNVLNTNTKSAVSVNNCKKKKRKRHKKRKQVEPEVLDVLCKEDVNTKFTSFSENIVEGAKPKHVIYSSVPCEKDSEAIYSDADKVQNSSKNTFVVTENMSLISAPSILKDYPKISTPTQADGCGNPSWQVSLTQSRNSEEPPIYEDGVKELTSDKSIVKKDFSQSLEEHKYKHLSNLNVMPKIGTYIAYKILELDENYSPIISEYREGVVKSVNLDTEDVEIELFKHMVKPGRTGKFENLKGDEVPFPEIKKCDVLKWSNIISPKLLTLGFSNDHIS